MASSKTEFDRQIERARAALSPVSVIVPSFKPADTDEKDGEMASFGKMLNDKAAELIATVSEDLAPSLELANPKVQQRIVVALAGAEEDLNAGMWSLPSWKIVETVAASLTKDVRAAVRKAVSKADGAIAKAIEYLQKQQADSKFRLKAAGAHWHSEHLAGPVEDCPLCEASLKDNPALEKELEALRSAGEAATRRFEDNVNAITAALIDALPKNLRPLLGDALPRQPRSETERDYRRKFVEAERYIQVLVKFKSLAEAAVASMPGGELAEPSARVAILPGAASVAEQLDKMEQMCRLAEWHEDHGKAWSEWWAKLMPADNTLDENLSSHIRHLRTALGEAEPYRIGADAMRLVWVQGRTAAAIEEEQQKRREIADDLAPLKQLGNLAEAQARNAINELSGRISAIHSATYIVDRLKFQEASLDKKIGLIVRGQLGEDMRIDATLVASTTLAGF